VAYIDKTLAPGERILSRGHFHWTYSLASWLWLLLAGWALVGIYVFFSRQIHKWTTELVVTNKRFVFKRGVLSIKTDEFTANRIQAITLTQPWMGRLLGYGQLNIRGEEIGQFGLPVIANPLDFRRALISSAEEAAKDKVPVAA
jgi:uncharacterized membrane protein YdbT with pleckstrin-like domain